MDITQKLYSLLSNLPFLASEIFLMLSFVLIVVVELILFRKKTSKSTQFNNNNWLWGFTLAILLFAAYITVNQSNTVGLKHDINAYFIIDLPSIFFKLIIVIATILLLFHIKILKYQLPNEFYPLLIFQIIGLFLLSIATNFLLIYISIEIVSIASYVYVTFSLNKKGAEAAIKYALFGGIGSAIMLYGISLLYGITGTLDMLNADFTKNLSQIDPGPLSLILLFTLAGFLFKISAFPFHLWVPDVYEVTSTPIVSYLSITPKAMGILVLSRLISVLPQSQNSLIVVIALASIALGNFAALRQSNVKRMLAYSTIAQSGFILASIASISNIGLQSAFFYIFGYIFSNMLAFFLIDILKLNGITNDYELKNYGGIGLKKPIWAILILIAMISLVGLPPTVGFTGKLFIFSAIWESYQNTHSQLTLFLFGFGLLNTAISLYYYLKLPFYAFFRKGTDNEGIVFSKKQILFSIIMAIPILFYFFKADLLMNWLQVILK